MILSCKVSGYPIPVVSWFKNHHQITFDSNEKRVIISENNSLIILNVTEKDEAIYSCRASSPTGKAVVKECNVYVKGLNFFNDIEL